MGFPDSFKLYPKEKVSYSQLGNAVTPPIIAIVGGSCVLALKGEKVCTEEHVVQTNRAAVKLVVDATGSSNRAELLRKKVKIQTISRVYWCEVFSCVSTDCFIETRYGRRRVFATLVVALAAMFLLK